MCLIRFCSSTLLLCPKHLNVVFCFQCLTNAADGIRLAARIVDMPCSEMNTDDFLEASFSSLFDELRKSCSAMAISAFFLTRFSVIFRKSKWSGMNWASLQLLSEERNWNKKGSEVIRHISFVLPIVQFLWPMPKEMSLHSRILFIEQLALSSLYRQIFLAQIILAVFQKCTQINELCFC